MSFLCIGLIFEVLRRSGNLPFEKLLLMINFSGAIRDGAALQTNLFGIESNPEEDFGFIFFITSNTSFESISFK